MEEETIPLESIIKEHKSRVDARVALFNSSSATPAELSDVSKKLDKHNLYLILKIASIIAICLILLIVLIKMFL